LIFTDLKLFAHVAQHIYVHTLYYKIRMFMLNLAHIIEINLTFPVIPD